MSRLASTAIVWIFAVPLEQAVAQRPEAPRAIRAISAASPEEFTRVTSVRELANGRVLVADNRENRLMLIDFGGTAPRSLARSGDGPGEFRSVSQVHRLRGDSTLVVDARALRWTVLAGIGVVRTLNAAPFSAVSQQVPLCGADNMGNVCVIKPKTIAAPQPGLPIMGTINDAESLVVLRVSLADVSRVDTLMSMPGRFLGAARGSKGGMNYFYYNPLAVESQAQLDIDGWLAYVSPGPYQVTWKTPDGNLIRGPVIEQPVTLDEAMKVRAIQEYAPSLARAGFTPSDFPKWPAWIPAIPNDALQLTWQKTLVIQRIAMPGRTERVYDVVDRTGKRIDRVFVPSNQRIVGFGASSVYVVTADSDGLEKLTKHPWP